LLFTLISELALLLVVASGESDILTALLLVGPDLTLYIDDAGIFVINGRRLPGILRLISMCLIAMSKDFLESVRPKPELSGDDVDLPDKLLRGECLSSCLGGTSFLIFITLSTILAPYTPGLVLSFALAYALFIAGTEPPTLPPPTGGRPLDGEQDCRLTLPLGAGSTDEDRRLGAPGRPLVAEVGLSERDVRNFGGASSENPGISDGFHGLGFTVGELARGGGAGFLAGTAAGVAVGRRVGVEALELGFGAAAAMGTDRPVGVEERGAVDLEVGVEDLAAGFVAGKVERVGVEDLDSLDEADEVTDDDLGRDDTDDDEQEVNAGLEGAVKVGRPVGVLGLEPGPLDEEGLRVIVFDDCVCCRDVKLTLVAGSGWAFANRDFNAVGRALGVPI
jgi:hypothetical protein